MKFLLCLGKRSGKKGQISLLDVPNLDSESLTATRSTHRPRVPFCWCDFICPLCFVARINRAGWIFTWNLSLSPIYHRWFPAVWQLFHFFFNLETGSQMRAILFREWGKSDSKGLFSYFPLAPTFLYFTFKMGMAIFEYMCWEMLHKWFAISIQFVSYNCSSVDTVTEQVLLRDNASLFWTLFVRTSDPGNWTLTAFCNGRFRQLV